MFLTVCLNPTLQKTLRFSAIIPDTVNRTGVHRLDASGKGVNVSRVLRQLGKDTVHLTQLGGVMRPLFLSLCAQDSLTVEWVESESPIRFCYTLIGDTGTSVTELVEESERVAAGTEERLMEKYDSLLADSNFLIISGTKAEGFSSAVIPTLVQKAKARDLPVILDVRGKDLIESLPYKPDIIKPNLYEFALTFAPDLVKDHDLPGDAHMVRQRIQETALELCAQYHCRMALTHGTGQIWAVEPGRFFTVDIEPVTPLNTTGCGDAFTAGLASALGGGAGFETAIAEGVRCGALNARCIRPGVIKE
jgi:1-phosphofructokinase/tagatose 6-phosphate kinase